MVPVPLGDSFTASQRQEIDSAIRVAEEASGFRFAVVVGKGSGDGRAYAERMHAALPESPRTVLVHVDPQARRLDIVTGSQVVQALPNRLAGLAAVTMESHFSAGDLVAGIVTGVTQLGEFATMPPSLHTDTP